MAKIDLTKISLYKMSWGNNYYFGRYKDGSNHYFELNIGNDGWIVVPFGSRLWNELDQQAWFGHDVAEWYEEGSNHKLPDWLPEIPTLEELQEIPSVNWRDLQKVADSFDADNYPHLKRYFIDNNLSEQKLYFALAEDIYESKYGDGTYRYLRLASFDIQEIIDFVASCKGEEKYDMGNGRKGTKYSHIGFFKEHTIVFEEGKFYMPDFEPDTFEHYKFGELLGTIEEKLKE